MKTLRRLDRHWLLNHPILWIIRLHWMICSWLLGLVLISLVAMTLPVSLPSVNFLDGYFRIVVLLTGLAVSPWVYLQTLITPQIRQNSRGSTATYLLAGYLFILGIHVAWPYAFVRIVEARISGKITQSEFRNDVHIFESMQDKGIYPVKEDLAKLILKYRNVNIYQVDSTKVGDTYFGLFNSLTYVSALKEADWAKAGPKYYDHWVVAPQIVLFLALVLRLFQVAGAKSLMATLLFVATFCVTLVSYSDPANEIFFGGVTAVFLLGAYATFRAISLKNKNALFLLGVNIFTLFLAWMPCLPLLFSTEKYSLDRLYFRLFFLGVMMLFAVTPWIQRRYLALQAKPF